MHSHFMRPRNRLYTSAAVMGNVAEARALVDVVFPPAFNDANRALKARDLARALAAARAIRDAVFIAKIRAAAAIAAGEAGAVDVADRARRAGLYADLVWEWIEELQAEENKD